MANEVSMSSCQHCLMDGVVSTELRGRSEKDHGAWEGSVSPTCWAEPPAPHLLGEKSQVLMLRGWGGGMRIRTDDAFVLCDTPSAAHSSGLLSLFL